MPPHPTGPTVIFIGYSSSPPKTPSIIMPAATSTLMIEGSTEELAEELAGFIDTLQKSEPIQGRVAELIRDGKVEDALKILIANADALNSAPEKCRTPLGHPVDGVVLTR
jgi:hypothetical protein